MDADKHRFKLKLLNSYYLILITFFSSLTSFSYSAEVDYKIRVYVDREKRVKEIPLEKYICGVVKGEISSKWPLMALKAQAVVARTYTFNQIKKNQKKHYDISNSIFNQVYRGGEIPHKILRAVRETEREIIIYHNNLAKVFYHSSSGGRTANVVDVWPSSDDLPYLQGVNDRRYSCGPKKYYPWFRSFALETLSEKFSVGKIDNLRILKKDKSGRVKEMIILGEKGKQKLTGKEFRHIMNLHLKQTNKSYFPSTLFDLEIKNSLVIFKGKGSGHGVGLSQWGAKKMAEEEKSYGEILKYYFPGTEIGKVILQ